MCSRNRFWKILGSRVGVSRSSGRTELEAWPVAAAQVGATADNNNIYPGELNEFW